MSNFEQNSVQWIQGKVNGQEQSAYSTFYEDGPLSVLYCICQKIDFYFLT